MILCGDFYQIEPVGKAIYSCPSGRKYDLHCAALWRDQVNVAVELTELKRSLDPKLNIVLKALRSGKFSEKDEAFKLLQSRYVTSDVTVNHTCIYEYNDEVNEHNYATPHIYAIQNKVKLFRISAQSTRKNGAEIPAEIRSVMYKRKVLCGEKKDGPIPHIDFFLGMKVSVYQGNHAVAAVGVGNGSVASIIGVLPSNALYNVAEHDIILPNGDTSKILRPRWMLQKRFDIPVFHGMFIRLLEKNFPQNCVCMCNFLFVLLLPLPS